MTKNELIRKVQEIVKEYPSKDVSYAVLVIIDAMTRALIRGERIDIRGFGNFTVRNHDPKIGRNPKTAGVVYLPARRSLMFKTGKELKNMINKSS
jgi:integration host factor subunit beta